LETPFTPNTFKIVYSRGCIVWRYKKVSFCVQIVIELANFDSPPPPTTIFVCHPGSWLNAKEQT
jgi:hypothetical protein